MSVELLHNYRTDYHFYQICQLWLLLEKKCDLVTMSLDNYQIGLLQCSLMGLPWKTGTFQMGTKYTAAKLHTRA